MELVEAGDVLGVLGELEAMTLKQRSSYAADLKNLHKTTDVFRHHDSDKAIALSLAGLACQVTPKAAANWLLSSRKKASKDRSWAVDAVNLYPAEWRAELVTRIGERAKRTPGEQQDQARRIWFNLAEHIICDTGCPTPTSDAFIEAWIAQHPFRRNRTSERTMGGAQILGGIENCSYAETVRNDAFTPILLPLALERPSIEKLPSPDLLARFVTEGMLEHAQLIRGIFVRLGSTWSCHMVDALVRAFADDDWLARERAALVEVPLARLLQDGTRMELSAPFATLQALAPTSTEKAPFLRDHVAMLDLSPPVASYGQEALIDLDEAGLLEPDVLTEACERVLLRPDKKLVRAQLSWLDRVARRDPASAGRAVVEAAAVFHHPDVALQERALDLVARHLRDAGEEVLANLQTAAEGISPGLAPRAAELFGRPPETPAEQYSEVLPAVPEPEPVPGPAETVAEVAQEAAAALANPGHVAAFERALDGLVRHARLDRSGLSEALKPVVRREPRRVGADWTQTDLYEVAVAVRGDERHDGRHTILRTDHAAERTVPEYRGVTPAGDMLRARMSEVLKVIESGTQPFLLAVPTLDTGALDAGVLVERIAEFERLRVIPAPVDLAQALLRVDPAPGEQVQRAAEELESAAGRQLARWLGDGGLPHQDSTPRDWPVTDPTSAPPGWWEPERPGPAPQPPLPPVAAALLGDRRNGIENDHKRPFLLAQLPHHRDEVAARLDQDGRRTSVPPYRTDAAGPAGYAIHWHIAYGLRGTADPLLVLAAQGRLDSRLLAGQLQALLHRGVIEANRVTATLRTAAETGAYATVWSVLEAALPALLRGKSVHGAAAFLALAVECASRCGATGPIAEVDAVAARKGSTQTIKNARLLRDVLH